MHPISVLIKPSSGKCNMRCKYCFYCDEARNRRDEFFGFMSTQTAENIVKKTIGSAAGQCTFAFQGGEPTLIGLDFYRNFVSLVKKHNTKRLKIHFAIQTNGYLIDRDWAQFFSKNNFLVGLSIDGYKDIHDKYRVDAGGKGTYSRVMRAAQLLSAYDVDFNVLATVTADVARNTEKVYNFFVRNRFFWQQYIACIDPIDGERGRNEYSISPPAYGEFLKKLFDLWYRDQMRNKRVSIRYFEDLVLLMAGHPPEVCSMAGHCRSQYVVEADGGVYPCDFYCLDEYLLGNINTEGIPDIDRRRGEIGFIEKSLFVDERCKTCEYGALCRGGCRRDRDDFSGGNLRRNYFCEAYKVFFDHAIQRLEALAVGYRDSLCQ